jgi:hypothetical protein
MSCQFSPFVFRVARQYIYIIKSKEHTMNWVFETYSNVYQTAMMQDVKLAPKAKTPTKSVLARLFRRG